MSIQCPNCRAGQANLEPIVEHLAGGAILQTVRCILCGERKSRSIACPVGSRPQTRQHPAAAPATAAPATAAPQRRRHSYESNWTRCAVPGCKGQYVPGRSRNGWPLCKAHRNRMQGWVRTNQTTPAPLIEIADNWWADNPDRNRTTPGGAPC